jgi:hypothetical protein
MKMEEALQKEESLRSRAAQLDDAKRKIYYARLDKSIKDPDTYAVLNWIFLAGLHHFYLKKYLRGSLNLGGFLLGVAMLFTPFFIVGIIIIGLILIFELYELFFSQTIILEYNNKIAEDILAELDASV